MDPLDALTDQELEERLDALRAEELRRILKAGIDPQRQSFYRQTEKLATLGILARGLAHELNNIFTGIIAHCDYALKEGDDEARRRALEVALGSTRKASVIVKSVQSFARQEVGRRTLADPAEVVRRAVELLSPLSRTAEVPVVVELEAVPGTMMDADGIQQVVVHLLTNAVQASARRSPVEVAVREEGGDVVIVVRDHGRGIPDDARSRIFTPFFSTKGVYAKTTEERQTTGTGLGLAVVYGVVRQHGGSVSYDSKLNVGTTFTVRFPLKRPEQDVA